MTAPRLYLDDGDVQLWHAEAYAWLQTMPDGYAQTCVTSPPFYGLRDYGTAEWVDGDDSCDHIAPPRGGRNPDTSSKQLSNAGTLDYQYPKTCGKCGAVRVDEQIGLEETPQRWAAKLLRVFREVRRVLRDDGTLWVEVGDSYASSGQTGLNVDSGTSTLGWNPGGLKDDAAVWQKSRPRQNVPAGMKAKDLIGAPWLLAFALRADGWYLRADCIWSRPNPMPSSVTDRPTIGHSYIFLFSKSARYYYDQDAIREPVKPTSGLAQAPMGRKTGTVQRDVPDYEQKIGANARSVWTIAPEPSNIGHYAMFPQAIPRRCIMAATSEVGCCPKCGAGWVREVERVGGVTEAHTRPKRTAGMDSPTSTLGGASGSDGWQRIGTRRLQVGWQPGCSCNAGEPIPAVVIDPFVGSGTTLLVARALNRHGAGCDLSADFLSYAAQRLAQRALWTPEPAAYTADDGDQLTLDP